MESAPFFTPDSMVLSDWALPQLDFCILRVEKTARLLNQRSACGGRRKAVVETARRRCPLWETARRLEMYSRVAQSDLPTPAPGSLRISPRPQMEGGRLGEGRGKVFMGFYIGKPS